MRGAPRILRGKTEPPPRRNLEKVWRPHIETCLIVFCPQRSVFESNFPVDKGHVQLSSDVEYAQENRGRRSADGKAALFSGATTKEWLDLQVEAIR
jgi:L-fuconolactonase